jgi:phosphodiesterase/alkaline phosphatase D-like protein
MIKNLNLKWLIILSTIALICFITLSCSGEDEEKSNNGSYNTTDVAVTSNVVKLGITYAQIEGYVNLNLITSSYTEQEIGIELSTTEDFNKVDKTISKELEGNKLSVVIDTLSGNTKYFYRTFVKVNDLSYYGEKRSFTTENFNNIT